MRNYGHYVITIEAMQEPCTVIVADAMFATTLFPVVVFLAGYHGLQDVSVQIIDKVQNEEKLAEKEG